MLPLDGGYWWAGPWRPALCAKSKEQPNVSAGHQPELAKYISCNNNEIKHEKCDQNICLCWPAWPDWRLHSALLWCRPQLAPEPHSLHRLFKHYHEMSENPKKAETCDKDFLHPATHIEEPILVLPTQVSRMHPALDQRSDHKFRQFYNLKFQKVSDCPITSESTTSLVFSSSQRYPRNTFLPLVQISPTPLENFRYSCQGVGGVVSKITLIFVN